MKFTYNLINTVLEIQLLPKQTAVYYLDLQSLSHSKRRPCTQSAMDKLPSVLTAVHLQIFSNLELHHLVTIWEQNKKSVQFFEITGFS